MTDEKKAMLKHLNWGGSYVHKRDPSRAIWKEYGGKVYTQERFKKKPIRWGDIDPVDWISNYEFRKGEDESKGFHLRFGKTNRHFDGLIEEIKSDLYNSPTEENLFLFLIGYYLRNKNTRK
jgi:hypothetical protein